MIVSDTRRFVFIHNPKAAGTSVRKALTSHHQQELDLWGYTLFPQIGRVMDIAHLPIDVMIEVRPDLFMKIQSYYAFGFVRDPIQRFFSSVHQYLINFTPSINERVMVSDKKLFDAYVSEFACSGVSREAIDRDYRLAHFIQQKRFFFAYSLPCAKFFRIEDLSDSVPAELAALGITALGQENRTSSLLKPEGRFDESSLTPKARDRILALYQDDFEAFGYGRR
jgi:hypothetical protein